MTDAMSGLELSQRLFHAAAKPILDAQFPTLRYAAALIGAGSEFCPRYTLTCTAFEAWRRAAGSLLHGEYAYA